MESLYEEGAQSGTLANYLNFPSQFLLVAVSAQFDDCHLPAGASSARTFCSVHDSLYWKLQSAALKGLHQSISAGCFKCPICRWFALYLLLFTIILSSATYFIESFKTQSLVMVGYSLYRCEVGS